jgi:hypothetical protein
MKDVKPTSLLKDRGREVEGNPDFSNKDVASQTQVSVEVSSGINPPINHMELQPEVNNTSRAMSLPTILNQVGFRLALSIQLCWRAIVLSTCIILNILYACSMLLLDV